MTNRKTAWSITTFALALAASTPAFAVCGQQGSASDSAASAGAQCMKEYGEVAKACAAGKPECQTLAKQWESKWGEKSGFLDPSRSPTRPAGVPDKSTLPGKGQAKILPGDLISKPGGQGTKSGTTIDEKTAQKGIIILDQPIPMGTPGLRDPVPHLNPGAGRSGPLPR
jgi:hypothetical protein